MIRSIVFPTLIFLCSLQLNAFQDDQQTLLAKLTGHTTMSGGEQVTERYTQNNREVAADYLQKQLELFCDEASIEEYSNTGMNVIGVINATIQTDEWILIGAHYDSVEDCPGANDNATGVALTNEVARSIAAMAERKYNVYVVYFDEEEKGLIGSRNFAKKLKEEGINLLSAHTIDQLGWDADGDRAIELEKPTDELKAYYLKVAKDNGLEFPIHTTNVTATDHQAFRSEGFNAIGLTEEYKNRDTTPHYHRSTDTFDTVNLEYLATITDYMKKVFESLLTD